MRLVSEKKPSSTCNLQTRKKQQYEDVRSELPSTGDVGCCFVLFSFFFVYVCACVLFSVGCKLLAWGFFTRTIPRMWYHFVDVLKSVTQFRSHSDVQFFYLALLRPATAVIRTLNLCWYVWKHKLRENKNVKRRSSSSNATTDTPPPTKPFERKFSCSCAEECRSR